MVALVLAIVALVAIGLGALAYAGVKRSRARIPKLVMIHALPGSLTNDSA